MKTNSDFELNPPYFRDAGGPGVTNLTYPPARLGSHARRNDLIPDAEAAPPHIDPWSVAEAVARRWYWLALGAVAFGILAFFGTTALWKTSYTAKVQLIRLDSPAAAEALRDRQTSMQTFADLLRAPEVIQRVSAAAEPALSADALASSLVVTPDRNKESLTIAVTALTPEDAADLANLHSREALNLTRQLQVQEAAALNKHIQQQLAAIDNQTRRIEEQLRPANAPVPPTDPPAQAPSLNPQSASAPVAIQPETPQRAPSMTEPLSSLKRSILEEQIRAAQVELGHLLTQYTDASPLVQAQRMKLAVLEMQFEDNLAAAPAISLRSRTADTATTLAPSPLIALSPRDTALRTIDFDLVRGRLASLEAARLPLAGRQALFQNLMDNPPGQLQVLIPARPQDAIKNGRDVKVASVSVFAALVGVFAAALLVLLVEATGRRLKTDDDVRRVTRLPVIASLGNLRKMTQSARDRWAAQAWTALQGRLNGTAHRGLVCGIISSSGGEGRSTLTHLLARAASQHGYRVLTINTCPEGATNGSLNNGHHEEPDTASDSPTITANVLASPENVSHKLVGANPQVIVHISLPDWSWNLERRKQLEAALDHWRTIDNVVILVNLPPASKPQAALLAEDLSNVVWLADSGQADAAATRTQIETLRQTRCRLVGAVLNHAPSHPLKNLFPRWVAA